MSVIVLMESQQSYPRGPDVEHIIDCLAKEPIIWHCFVCSDLENMFHMIYVSPKDYEFSVIVLKFEQ